MYITTIYNNGIPTEIHGEEQKLSSGNVVKGINTIDAFSFSIFPSNSGFYRLNEFTTLVDVFNTRKNRYEFQGRVLYSSPAMSESGLIAKAVTCESYLGFLCDSQQIYVDPKNWTVIELFTHIVDVHNSQVEDYKHFAVGEVTVTDPNDNLYLGIQRKNTWETLKEKLITNLGGEIRFRVVDGVIYLDYLEKIGETKATPIALSRNMKSITKEKDPSAYVTRLIPLGCKLTKEEITTDENGNETTETVKTEERLDISSVNDGKNYIDDEQAIAQYGLHIAYQEWDDVTEPQILKTKGENWLINNNKLKIKYAITALDLSLLGLDIDDFEVHNSHPIENSLLGIDDIARINKKNIDICEEVKSTIEVGENFKTLSDIQVENAGKIESATATIKKIESDYVTNERLYSETKQLNSLIKQSADTVMLSVSENYLLKTGEEVYKSDLETALTVLKDSVMVEFINEITTVQNSTQSEFERIYSYIKMADGAITFGASGNSITLAIGKTADNEQAVIFYRNGVEFGSWDGENFYTGNIIIRLNERFQLGNFARLPRSDGSVVLLKVGG